MSLTHRLLAFSLALVLLGLTGIGALLTISGVGDLLAGQVGLVRGLGELVGGLILAVLCGTLTFMFARRGLTRRFPNPAA